MVFRTALIRRICKKAKWKSWVPTLSSTENESVSSCIHFEIWLKNRNTVYITAKASSWSLTSLWPSSAYPPLPVFLFFCFTSPECCFCTKIKSLPITGQQNSSIVLHRALTLTWHFPVRPWHLTWILQKNKSKDVLFRARTHSITFTDLGSSVLKRWKAELYTNWFILWLQCIWNVRFNPEHNLTLKKCK